MQRFERIRHGSPERQPIGQIFVVLLVLLVMLIAGFLFLNSPYFTVGQISVEGNKYIAVEEIYRIAGIPEPVNIFRLNTADIKDNLKNDLRVTDVDVTRKFPSTIVISVKERQPLVYVASGYGFFEVDKQGVILAALKNLKQINVPMVTGLRLESGYVGDTVSNPEIKPVLEYLSNLDTTTLNQISEVNIKYPESIIAYTVSSAQIRIGKNERIIDKARLTNEILREINGKNAALEYIDLNFSSPFIKFKQ